MYFAALPAFAGLSPLPDPSRLQIAQRSITPRRTRRYHVSARSLDSYREGNRFGDDDRSRRSRNRHASSHDSARKNGLSEVRPARPKTRVPLVNALCSMNVASIETCEFLVRSGRVRVNGVVVSDQKAKIHRFDDDLVVNGLPCGTMALHEGNAKTLPGDENGEMVDTKFLPRGQRDFRNSPRPKPGPENFKKYSRRVDRGFFSSRRYHGGK